MGRILEYVVLLSNLSLILGGQQLKEPSNGSNYEREKPANFTIKQYHPKGQSELFSKRLLPLDYQARRRLLSSNPKDMRKMIGLHAFASEDFDRKGHKRNFSDSGFRNFNHQRRNVGAFSQNLNQRKNSKNFGHFHWGVPSQRLSRLYNYQNKPPEDGNQRYQKEGRNARFHSRHSAKICDSCNNVPWIPILNVPDSYRQQRTHLTELHPTPQEHVNFDYHGFASDSHNVLLPPVPIVPPVEPIYDGTISSSFGLPIGNIPTGHGLLAPLNHLPTIDYSNSFNFYSPHGLLESPAFPELSPVPVVPIHDSGQFYQFDSSIPDLVPPPTAAVDVSKVVLTINEENSSKLQPPKPAAYHNHKPEPDLSSSTAVNSHSSHSQGQEKNQHKDFGRLEIVKSVPLAEFTSAVKVPQQDLPLYPPLQNEFPEQKELHSQKPPPRPDSDYNFLVPPPKLEPGFSENKTAASFSKHGDTKELLGEPSAPKPLTSPSLSWLFSDHTAPPADSKSTASVLSFSTEAQEIASVVNNELRPVSPRPVPISLTNSQNVGNTKSKKIQIIIPYTTKNKNEQDNNALESVQHEVFQTPVSKSTNENNSLRDLATPALPPLSHQTDTNRDRKVIDQQEDENKNGKYLSEMQHILASNIRELLREEIEKSQSDQNFSLQNNIDNWTALEYSNHKTVETKAPKEIITQALAVTSIPGTSISHLLLPSKKIPNEYFKTTPIPVYDEPTSSVYKTTNSTVNSSPFTAKPYATTNVYNPIKDLRENVKSNKENISPIIQRNHERNYTEVGRGRVNNWGRLNENMVLPAARSKTRKVEETSTLGWTGNRYVQSGSEKIQIVTPISLTTQRNYTPATFRRTTRHIHKVGNPTTAIPDRNKYSIIVNSTKLEKVSSEKLMVNHKLTYNSTSSQNVSSSGSVNKEMTNSTVLVAESVKTKSADSAKNQTSEESSFNSKNEHFSINDIFPFRNKELPWQTNLNISQSITRIGRQRKSLIKQVNFQRSKSKVKSS